MLVDVPCDCSWTSSPIVRVYAACIAVAPKLDLGPKELRRWMGQVRLDSDERAPAADELEELTALRADVRALTGANEILKAVSIFRE